MTTRVINCKGGNRNFDVYIGRWTWPIKINSKWGNPFKIEKVNGVEVPGSREKVIRQYHTFINHKIIQIRPF